MPGYAAIAAPTPSAPTDGSTQNQAPVFAWSAVPGASYYYFQVSADAGFNSHPLGTGTDDFNTRNTRAALTKVLPDGNYWWRVRAVDSGGTASAWSVVQTFTKTWTDAPQLASPDDGAAVSFSSGPLVLDWNPVPYAMQYNLTVASDPALTTVVTQLSGSSATSGTQFATDQLKPGTYWWQVTPLDASAHTGMPSEIRSFTWDWPSSMSSLDVTDTAASSTVFDPQFSWAPVGGAKGYELEVNSASDFGSSSKVCCNTTIYGTTYSPLNVLENNAYYWRVRPIDVSGAPGDWTQGSPFTQTYDNTPPSVGDLRLIAPDGTDLGTTSTDTPIVTWTPVDGASYYEVNVTTWTGAICDWGASNQWNSKTVANYWTPLGNGWNGVKPYQTGIGVSGDSVALATGGNYCVRVRALRDRSSAGGSVFGTYSYLGGGSALSFTFSGYPAGGTCTPSCNGGYLGDSDYILPVTGTTSARVPLFTWAPLSGSQAYYVIVAKDASFTNVIDYAFTHIPAYAPRQGSGVRTYTDETTSYYWAVLPATNFNGSLAAGEPTLAAAKDFLKQSVPSALDLPADVGTVDGTITFSWGLTEATRKFHLQIDDQSTFGSPLVDLTTDSTSYTTNGALPLGTLYWRVQAQDENNIGLNWSAVRSFTHTLPKPTITVGANSASGPDIPSWRWNTVEGAAKYELQVQWERSPGNTTTQSWQTTSTAWTATEMTGTGFFQWRVRALFPKTSGTQSGDYTTGWQSYTRTIPEPVGLASDVASTTTGTTRAMMIWNPRLGAKEYRVQVSTTNSFGAPFDSVTTNSASWAPTMYSASQYGNGGTLYWRVQAVDADGNGGDWGYGTLGLPSKMVLTASPSVLSKGTSKVVTITVKNAYGAVVVGAKVTLSGAGVRAVSKNTGTKGTAAFTIKPTKAGKIAVTAAKAGFFKGSFTITAY
ncbi:MAG: large repetitive protein [Nocardioidaceae bacterium]|nr:large repetitive protein [Nocardioidaceae bacterium]